MASTGNCSSENGVPSEGPKRNICQESALVSTRTFGNALGRRTPAATWLKGVTLNPERARETWSGR